MTVKKASAKKSLVKKAAPKKKTAKKAVVKKAAMKEAYECGDCGYMLVAVGPDRCYEKHVFICCGKPMKKTVKKAPAAKKK
jgi:hypothetical protein